MFKGVLGSEGNSCTESIELRAAGGARPRLGPPQHSLRSFTRREEHSSYDVAGNSRSSGRSASRQLVLLRPQHITLILTVDLDFS